jgi:hypothetical protein
VSKKTVKNFKQLKIKKSDINSFWCALINIKIAILKSKVAIFYINNLHTLSLRLYTDSSDLNNKVSTAAVKYNYHQTYLLRIFNNT